MMNSPIRIMGEDKNLMYSGMFLRPHIAESLRVLICTKVIQERAQFTVAKSQVHPNGLCEIVVKKQDPNVSTNAIMELLKQCRSLVEENGFDSARRKDDLNCTIDLSDDSICVLSPTPCNDSISVVSPTPCNDSICVVSPTPFSNRTVTVKRTILSPFLRGELESPVNRAPTNSSQGKWNFKESKNDFKLLSLQSSDLSRKVSFKRSIPESTGTTGNFCETPEVFSLEPTSKRPNILVQVSNNLRTSCSPKGSDSKPLSPKFVQDALPSAPLWTSSELSKFPLSNVNKILGAKDFDQDRYKPPSGSVNFKSNHEVPDQSFSLELSNKVPKTTSYSLSSDKNSCGNESAFKADIPIDTSINKTFEILEGSEGLTSRNSSVNSCSKLKDGNNDEKHGTLKCSAVQCKSQAEGNNSKESSDAAMNVEVSHGNDFASDGYCMSENGPQRINESQKKIVCAATDNGCGSKSNDDDIIIEKEVLSDSKTPTHALIIDDSDDDIAVCEVVHSKIVTNAGMLSKKSKKKAKRSQKKQMMQNSEIPVIAGTNFTASTSGSAPNFIHFNQHWMRSDPKTSICVGNAEKMAKPQSPVKIPAGSNFTAATTSGSAPDFIPLNQHYRRIDPKTSNYVGNTSKMAKRLKVEEKKLKKSKAQHNLVERNRNPSSSQSGNKKQEVPSKERHEFNSNVMNPNSGEPKSGLRPIVIDASNVAVGHGRGLLFSVAGLKICIKYFTDRGHKVHAIVPKYRRFHVPPEDRKAMDDLENEGILSYSPSRTMADGRKLASYDDRFIVQTAAELGGVVVSTDNFRDLLSENQAWRETIEQRLLMFTWVGDMLLFPNDPMGRHGPHLTEFLRFPDSLSKS